MNPWQRTLAVVMLVGCGLTKAFSNITVTEVYVVGKSISYIQTSDATPVVQRYNFEAAVQGTAFSTLAQSPTVALPGGSQTITLISRGAGTNEWSLQDAVTHNFADKSSLDAAFPNGTYTYTFDFGSTVSVPLVLSPDSYPSEAPMLTTGTWNGSGQLVIDPTQAYDFAFNTFSNYSSGGAVFFSIFGSASNTRIGDALASAYHFASNEDLVLTGFTLPANTLGPGLYYAELSFIQTTALDFASVSGATGVAFFAHDTGFIIEVIPEPSTIALLVLGGALLCGGKLAGAARRRAVKAGLRA